MTNCRVTFKCLIQDSQEYGSDDEHMVSRAFFDVEIDGREFKDACVDIKQPVGSQFENAPLEVSSPAGYDGPHNFKAFREAAEAYYRSLVGKQGSGISISNASSNIRMYKNTFNFIKAVEFEVQEESPAW